MLEVTGLGVSFGSRRVLSGVELNLETGATLAVMGPSGAGKSTLLRCIAGLVLPDEGEVHFDGRTMSRLRSRARCRRRLESIGIVFQDGELLDELTVAENVALPLQLQGRSDRARVEALLQSVGLADLGHRWPGSLSGGEVQRAAIARALVARPSLVLADEPTGALDDRLTGVVGDLLIRACQDGGATLVVATHDGTLAQRLDQTLRLVEGGLRAVR